MSLNSMGSVQSRAGGDHHLLRRIGEGDIRAFDEFYGKHSRLAYGMAIRVLGGGRLAEDAVQEAFVNVWRTASSDNSDVIAMPVSMRDGETRAPGSSPSSTDARSTRSESNRNTATSRSTNNASKEKSLTSMTSTSHLVPSARNLRCSLDETASCSSGHITKG